MALEPYFGEGWGEQGDYRASSSRPRPAPTPSRSPAPSAARRSTRATPPARTASTRSPTRPRSSTRPSSRPGRSSTPGWTGRRPASTPPWPPSAPGGRRRGRRRPPAGHDRPGRRALGLLAAVGVGVIASAGGGRRCSTRSRPRPGRWVRAGGGWAGSGWPSWPGRCWRPSGPAGARPAARVRPGRRVVPRAGAEPGRAHLHRAARAGLSSIQRARHRRPAGPARRGGPVDGAPLQFAVGLGDLADGTYTVSWRVVSKDDGHVTAGSFAFGVGVPAPTATRESQAALPGETPSPSAPATVARLASTPG